MRSILSFYKPGEGFIKSFVPKYAQGDKVFVRRHDAFHRPVGPLMLGTIKGANLDRDLNFVSWFVSVRSLGHYLTKYDPKCPWSKPPQRPKCLLLQG